MTGIGGQTARLGLHCLIVLSHILLVPLCRAAEPRERPLVEEQPITADDREHWSFQPVVVSELPHVAHRSWTRNPIDYFILERLEQIDLEPAPSADNATLLRRLKLDLLGLPPTPAELSKFESDCQQDPAAYQHWVERWLDTPAFGERQAQAWLDLARFAETDGFEHDRVREGAWAYRDWVIAAFNADMPYDRFIALQLHGDLTGSPADQIATMFCLASADMPDLNEQDLRRHDRLNELTSTVGSALLGLQMHCAQCHDHKYDPISQADFYRLRGVFESAVPELQRDKPFNLLAGHSAEQTPRLYYRGELHTPGPLVQPAVPRIGVLPGREGVCDTDNPRTAFSAWLFTPDNPLTARVIVNRIWQQHFGVGIFDSPSDVGVVAGGPSHPELLDWMADFLPRQGWSLKQLHREIVLSATYRQSSRSQADDPQWGKRLSLDPNNVWYSRYPRRRLEGEVIRDAMLAVAGLLDSQASGPSVMPPLPQELTGTLLKGQWNTSPREADHYRRSIYVFARRNLRYPLFDVFDRPDAGASCPQRDRSTTAIQSLQMLNSELSNRCATALQQRVTRAVNPRGRPADQLPGGQLPADQLPGGQLPADQLPGGQLPADQLPADQPWAAQWIHALFQTTLGRTASESEVGLFSPLTADEQSRFIACLALLNTNEFLIAD
jgi:hypothetical protein